MLQACCSGPLACDVKIGLLPAGLVCNLSSIPSHLSLSKAGQSGHAESGLDSDGHGEPECKSCTVGLQACWLVSCLLCRNALLPMMCSSDFKPGSAAVYCSCKYGTASPQLTCKNHIQSRLAGFSACCTACVLSSISGPGLRILTLQLQDSKGLGLACASNDLSLLAALLDLPVHSLRL